LGIAIDVLDLTGIGDLVAIPQQYLSRFAIHIAIQVLQYIAIPCFAMYCNPTLMLLLPW
jgi:hypothetical protein